MTSSVSLPQCLVSEFSDDQQSKLKYEKIHKIGEGTYAVVYLVREASSGSPFAMKKVKKITGASGMDFAALREIKWLSTLRHPNIVNLVDVFTSRNHIHMILSYSQWDLEKIIKDKNIIFMPSDIKSWLLMILKGLDYCHQSWVLHRVNGHQHVQSADIKPSNMLISENGALQLADFGLARDYGQVRVPLSPNVVTRWYKAPELLFGSTHYTHAVDVWAVGCVFAELMLRKAYLPGDSDLDQLKKICQALGTPSKDSWPDMCALPDFVELPVYPRCPLHLQFSAASSDALDLLSKMLIFNPLKRITSREALLHPYFSNAPRPTPSENLPKPREPSSKDAGASVDISKGPYNSSKRLF